MKILVIDDEEGICDLLVEMCRCQSDDYEVDQALSAEEAYVKLCGNHFDVVISDVKMKNLSGVDLYERLKQEDRCHMPFVFLSGTPETYWRIPDGCKFFEKPVRLQALFDHLLTLTPPVAGKGA